MTWASLRSSRLARRAPSLLIALLIEALLLLALLSTFGNSLTRKSQPSLVTITPTPPQPPAKTRAVVRRKDGGSAPPRPAPRPSPVKAPPTPPAIVKLSRTDFAASDIGKIASARGEGAGTDSAAEGHGEGPGGAPLYNAEWYVEPTPGQLANYLPQGRSQPGWGMIICQTMPAYRVDNCRALSESPAGSGLARALRQAAWQFRVVPPRVGGRPIIGAWVRIRFDWLERAG